MVFRLCVCPVMNWWWSRVNPASHPVTAWIDLRHWTGSGQVFTERMQVGQMGGEFSESCMKYNKAHSPNLIVVIVFKGFGFKLNLRADGLWWGYYIYRLSLLPKHTLIPWSWSLQVLEVLVMWPDCVHYVCVTLLGSHCLHLDEYLHNFWQDSQ